MTVKIAIIGLGQIGASIGLALAEHKEQLSRVGHDRSPKTAQKAKEKGAVDRIEYSLPTAVEGADIVVLALPADQVYETLKIIAQDVREGAVIMDTSPAKTKVAGWVKELLPPNRHYVGLTPAVNPLIVHENAAGQEGARADLFKRGLIAISAPPGTVAEVLKLAADLAAMLGAAAFFGDQAEMDGVMASAHLLPQLTAAALVEATVSQPGWSDIRKLAGRPYAAATTPVAFQDEPAAMAEAVLHNRENTVRLLDDLIAVLKGMRDEVANEDAAGLKARLERARQGRFKWWKERSAGDWQSVEFGKGEMPKVGDFWKRQLGDLRKLFGPRGEQDEAQKK